MRYLLVAVMIAAASCSENDFGDIKLAKAAFVNFSNAFDVYKTLMQRTGLVFEIDGPIGGPPFDMWHNIELVHRDMINMTSLVDNSALWWGAIVSALSKGEN